MLRAVVIQLEALTAGTLPAANGREVHGLWFHHWQTVDRALADQLHADQRQCPFTLSPLLGLGAPQHGQLAVAPGASAWFRVTTLTAELSQRLEEAWLPRLPETVMLGPLSWRVTGLATTPAAHPWADSRTQDALAVEHLLNADPPRQWHLHFATPTAFHSAGGHLPFPLPGALIGSWLRRWQAFGPVALPEDLADLAQQRVLISSYRLHTVPVREGQRTTIGCVGDLTVSAPALRPGERAMLDLLAAYAFWAGSGHHTPQGLGVTRLLPPAGS